MSTRRLAARNIVKLWSIRKRIIKHQAFGEETIYNIKKLDKSMLVLIRIFIAGDPIKFGLMYKTNISYLNIEDMLSRMGA